MALEVKITCRREDEDNQELWQAWAQHEANTLWRSLINKEMADFENKRCQLSINRTFGESWMYIFLGLYNLWVARLVERWKLTQKKSWGIKVKAACRVRMQPVQYDRSWNSKFRLNCITSNVRLVSALQVSPDWIFSLLIHKCWG